MFRSGRNPWVRTLTVASLVAVSALGLSACQTKPDIRTQSAPGADLLKYQTFGFVEHPDTDKAGYTTLTTRYLKEAVTREMLARGYSASATPDLVVNFIAGSKDKVEGTTGPSVGVGYGRWYRGFGWGVGIGDRDIRTFTEGSLTIDVVDHARSELVWTGTAAGRLTKKVLQNPQPAIDKAVAAIFAKYPRQPVVAPSPPQ